MMSSYMTFPFKEYIDQVIHIFSYLRKHKNAKMVFDPRDPVIDEANHELKYWKSSDAGHVQGQE